MDVIALSLAEASELVRLRKISPVELTQASLERIDKLDGKLNAFITVTGETALAEARVAEAQIARGEWCGPLHGIPIALKDLVETAGVRTTAASALRKDNVPVKDAEVARRLRAARAVCVGKTNLHEFAYGGSSAISSFGPVRNPWSDFGNGERSPGGSSGGSAAAVATGMCFAAIGTDTGGSIRQPAAYCGIVGLKPTYGRVSAEGVVPLSWMFDHVGPMTRTVKDAALVLAAIADGADHVASLDAPVSELRVGVLRELFFEGIDAEIAGAMEQALRVIGTLASEVRDAPPLVPDYAGMMKVYTAVLTAEAYAYHKDDVAKAPEAYQPATLKRILAGAKVTREEYEAGKREVQRVRAAIGEVFKGVDVLITPTVAVPPYRIDELIESESARPRELEMLRDTRPINFFGLPAISMPCGFTRAGLPIGIQIIGGLSAEATVLRLAHAYEQATEWHNRRPSIASQ
jgi:aspartyl-tRNA(Asn)/glutamyl-tRNA(Gln) amidotransferase subunit A